MKKGVITILVPFIFFACGSSQEKAAIDMVKEYPYYYGEPLSTEDYFAQVIGVEDELYWDAFRKPNTDNIWVVELLVYVNQESDNPSKALYQWLINENTGTIEYGYAEVNGAPNEILGFYGSLFDLEMIKATGNLEELESLLE